MSEKKLLKFQEQIIGCVQCPRLVAWRQKVAHEKVRRFAKESYWGKPIPGFGDYQAKLFIVGLAPAAHGGNRTGRLFTGDRSGDWLFDALHNFGFSNQPNSTSILDGLALKDCYITAALHCAPPQNKPTKDERDNCFDYLPQEIKLLKKIQVIVVLGKIAFDTVLKYINGNVEMKIKNKPQFKHGNEIKLNNQVTLICSYHPSQQNTFTGKLTKPMFYAIFDRIAAILDRGC